MIITSPKTEIEYRQYYNLRWRILRKPWGEPAGSERDNTDTKGENYCHHIIATDNNIIYGVARLEFTTTSQFQLRYMAVDDTHQHKGIGKDIIKHAEKYSRNKNAIELFLNARENALGFYEKMGYTVTEKSYVLFGAIQHFKMHKKL